MPDQQIRDNTPHVWNKVALLYEAKFMDLDIYNETYDTLCSLIPPQGQILELACGPGNLSRYLLTQRPDLQLTGIDIAPNMIDLARKHNPTAQFETGDIRDLQNIKGQYNAVICGFGLPYLSTGEAGALFTRLGWLTLPGGSFYLSFVAGPPALSGPKTSSSGDTLYFYYHDEDTIRQQLTDAGWRISKEAKITYDQSAGQDAVHTILICTKS